MIAKAWATIIFKPARFGILARLLCVCISTVAAVTLAAGQAQPATEVKNDIDTKSLLVLAGVTADLNKHVEAGISGLYSKQGKVKGVVVQLPIKINCFVSITPAYVYAVGENRFRENRFRFDVTPQVTISKIKFEDRNLVEQRFTSSGNSTRYRNLLRATRTVKIFKQPFSFFVYDEAWYDPKAGGWARNFVAVGGSHTFSKRWTVQVYYARDNERYTQDINILGLTLSVKLFGKEAGSK